MGTKGARVTMDVSLAGRFLVYSPGRQGLRRLEAPARRRARPPARPRQAAAAEGRRRADRPHRRPRRPARGARARPAAARAAVGGDPGRREAQDREGAGADPRGGRPRARDGARRPPRRGRRGDHGRRGHVRADPRLRRGSTRPSSCRGSSCTRRRRRCCAATRSRTRSARRCTAASTCRPAATSCSTTPRRSRSSTSTRAGSSASARLEDTILANNLEAAREVVRQLRLRDIGGMIVIDFIDMAPQKNRDAVIACLQEELKKDRSKVYLTSISPLGLVEMTRQNVTDGVREIMTATCPTCHGEGRVLSKRDDRDREPAHAAPARRAVARARRSWSSSTREIAALMVGPGGSRLAELERSTGKHFSLVGVDGRADRALQRDARGQRRPRSWPRRSPVRVGRRARARDRRAAHVPGRRRGRVPRRRLPDRGRRRRAVPRRAPHACGSTTSTASRRSRRCSTRSRSPRRRCWR